MSIDHDETELPLDAVLERLHADAAAGDPQAAGELGRLLCLLRPDEELLAVLPWNWLAPDWPAEPWLRAALASRPDDINAAALLAGLLTQRFKKGLEMYSGTEDAALQDEATELYARILSRDPGNATAKAGLAAIQDLLESFRPADGRPADITPAPGFSFYRATWSAGSGSSVWSSNLIATDPREFRWALDWELRGIEDYPGGPAEFFDFSNELAITIFASGEPAIEIQLEPYLGRTAERPVEWAEFTLPALTGELLPVGHPALVGGGDDRIEWLAYGASSSSYT